MNTSLYKSQQDTGEIAESPLLNLWNNTMTPLILNTPKEDIINCHWFNWESVMLEEVQIN